MIYQWHPNLGKSFRKYACYELVLDQIASSISRVPMDVSEIRDYNTVYLNKGWIDDEHFIERPDKILLYHGLPVLDVKKEGNDYVCKENEVEVCLWRRRSETYGEEDVYGNWVYHFVRGDGEGLTTYDPWGISKTATMGEMRSKRIIAFDFPKISYTGGGF